MHLILLNADRIHALDAPHLVEVPYLVLISREIHHLYDAENVGPHLFFEAEEMEDILPNLVEVGPFAVLFINFRRSAVKRKNQIIQARFDETAAALFGEDRRVSRYAGSQTVRL